MQPGAPFLKSLVLVGGGHSHAIVLKRLGMRPLPGVRISLIARDVHTPYSGMLPGLIAGHYDFDETHIDLGPLSLFAGARLIDDEVIGIDVAARHVITREHPPIAYDIISLNTGSTPELDSVPGARGVVIPVKPIASFLARWESLLARVRARQGRSRVAIVGAGAGGIELSLSTQHRLAREIADRPGTTVDVHVFSSSDRVLPTHPPRVQRRFRSILRERDITLHENARAARIEPHTDGAPGGFVHTESGLREAFDEILWVTQASAPSWIAESGLDVDARGFLRVDETLRSTSHAEVFGAGDVASVVEHPREKAGVFAVRQGPPLDENLRRALTGRPLAPFRPQRRFLTIVSTGDPHAIAARGPWSIEGDWVWRWKDRIDRRFMEKLNRLEALPMNDAHARTSTPVVPDGLAAPDVRAEISALAMRCGGCGAKVGATVLSRVLERLEVHRGAHVVAGLDAPDDAAIVRVPAKGLLVSTVDSFRAIIDDPWLFGRIAALHALSDIWAMGATPRSALAIVTIPWAPEAQLEEELFHLLSGACAELRIAETSLVGGHTSEGAELSLGFAIEGVLDDVVGDDGAALALRKRGMRSGEKLILTKALGTGTLFAARMRLAAKGRWIQAAIRSMLISNQAAASCLRRHGASAATDVTGFGLLGHLVEMARASERGVEIDLAKIPLLDGVRETIAAGHLSSLQPQNVRLRRAIQDLERVVDHPLYPVLFDPQTSGGLVASVPADRADACVEELRALGTPAAAIIGTVHDPDPDRPELVRVRR